MIRTAPLTSRQNYHNNIINRRHATVFIIDPRSAQQRCGGTCDNAVFDTCATSQARPAGKPSALRAANYR